MFLFFACMLYLNCFNDAHFWRFPVIDRLKSQKTDCFNPHQNLGPIEIRFWWSHLCPIVFMVPRTSPLKVLLFPNEIWASGQHKRQTCWQVHLDCRGTRFGWSKWPCIVHVQSALSFFFVGSLAERKVNSWSEATLWQLSQDWSSMMWTLTFPILFTTTGFVFCKSGVLLFLHHRDTVSY